MKGKIIVFTGDGKGKTTASLGMAIRAIGHGRKVVIIQFLKKGEYGEIKSGILEIHQFGREKFVFEPEEKDFEEVKKAMEYAREALKRKPFMLILDEINVAVALKLVSIEEVVKLIEERGKTHVVLTGRNAPEEIIRIADLVTEMKKIKHYYDDGIEAIEGLEY